jgi:5'-3' exonuclease
MQPLLDLDILLYEVGFCAEGEEDGPLSFDRAAELFDNKVKDICAAVYATEDPILFLTGKNNFREEVATLKKYKGNRKDAKPFHYQNLKEYAKASYNVQFVDGLEADDLMCIEQTNRLKLLDTIICSRDKDLRQCQGFHYGWECGLQPEYGPKRVKGFGEIKLISPSKLTGTGNLFFYAQCLMGDPVDNIPGLPKCGPVKAYKTLKECKTDEEAYEKVLELYNKHYEEEGKERLEEQAKLLWMVREMEDDKPVMWRAPY